jgi:outer membrane murein-binding lipoprotein Lpp
MDLQALGVLVALLGVFASFIHRAAKVEALAEASRDHAAKIGSLESTVSALAETTKGTRDDVRYIRDRVDRALSARPEHT